MTITVDTHGIPDYLIINCGQTRAKQVPSGKWTIEKCKLGLISALITWLTSIPTSRQTLYRSYSADNDSNNDNNNDFI